MNSSFILKLIFIICNFHFNFNLFIKKKLLNNKFAVKKKGFKFAIR